MTDTPEGRKIHTKDSGNRQEFDTGARRDTSAGKPNWQKISIHLLNAVQQSYGGADVFDGVDQSQPPIVDPLPKWLPGRELQVMHRDYREDLIPELMINRLAHLYGRGEQKYGPNNWQKGIPLSRIHESMERHEKLWRLGDTSEDHLAAIIWNATAIMWTEWAIWHGLLPLSLADFGPLSFWRIRIEGD